MTDVFSPETRSAVMRRVRGRDTGPELTVRRLLTRLGARYRLHRRDLPGSPDVVMSGRRIAMFVHGCFWHGHDCPRGARKPKNNAGYWSDKLNRNRQRDARAEAALIDLGWRPEVVWECELKNSTALEQRLRRLLDPLPQPPPSRLRSRAEAPPR